MASPRNQHCFARIGSLSKPIRLMSRLRIVVAAVCPKDVIDVLF